MKIAILIKTTGEDAMFNLFLFPAESKSADYIELN